MLLNVEIVHQKDAWRFVLDHFESYDFVHTYDFYKVSEGNGEGVPLLFVVKTFEDKIIACWPLLRRSIPGSDYSDFSSAYGYGGPLFIKPHTDSKPLNYLFQKMRELGGVSIFSRLHPLYLDSLPTELLESGKLGDVVYIAVQGFDVLSEYRSSHRYEIKKSKSMGVGVLVDFNCEFINEFIKIYHGSMRGLDAGKYYFFNKLFFDSMAASNDFKPFIIFALFNGVKVAASMFIVTGRVMQYFLSGTLLEYQRLSPSKLIVAKAHELAIEMGVDKLILGGGVGSQQDNLFRFKSGFSNKTLPFYIFKKIIDPVVYENLCAEKGVDLASTSYFPAYRSSI